LRGAAIPVSKVRYPCVTHPSATKPSRYCYKEGPVRLACLSHAASVRSEPGSNSSFYSMPRRPPRHPFEYRSRAPVDFDSSHLAHRSAWLGRIGRLASSSSNPSSGPEPHVLTAVDHTHCSLVKELVRGPQAGLPANWPEHRMLSGALALSIGQSPELFRSIHFLPLASSHCKTRRKNNPV
jgi:hypothetical protein